MYYPCSKYFTNSERSCEIATTFFESDMLVGFSTLSALILYRYVRKCKDRFVLIL